MKAERGAFWPVVSFDTTKQNLYSALIVIHWIHSSSLVCTSCGGTRKSNRLLYFRSRFFRSTSSHCPSSRAMLTKHLMHRRGMIIPDSVIMLGQPECTI